MTDTTTIEISIVNAEKLHSCQESLQKFLHKRKVSADQVLSIFFLTKPLDLILTEWYLEENPSIKFDKKPKKEEKTNGDTNSQE